MSVQGHIPPAAPASRAAHKTPEWRDVSPETFRTEIVPLDRPAILRGLAADWPVVQAARRSPQALHDYLRRLDIGRPTQTFLGPPEIRGGFFYRDDVSGMNFERIMQPFHVTVAAVVAHQDHPDPPAIYAPGCIAAQGFPDFAGENPMPLVEAEVSPRLWIGNAINAPTHYDMHHGVAVVAAGRKRFTLFPPEQLPNLYVGPLDLTPAGQPTSLVRLTDPDFERFPRFADALAAAEVADLEPGDGVFIPNMWWHNVESYDPVNLLVNYWWQEGARGGGSPFAALVMGLLAITELPPSRREIWRQIFDHYVFRTAGDPVPYLPEDRRGMLGEPTPRLESYMREGVIRSLIDPLPKPALDEMRRRIGL